MPSNLLTSHYDPGPGTSITTASFTPVSGELVLAFLSRKSADVIATAPTCTGTNGLNVTWTRLQHVIHVGVGIYQSFAVFRGVPSSGTAGTLTFTFSPDSDIACNVSVLSFSGVDQTTNQGVVQSVTNQGTSATASVALAAFGSGSNITVWGAGYYATSSLVWTPGASYTKQSDLTAFTSAVGTAWLASSDTAPSGTIRSSSTAAWEAIGVELTVSTAGGGGLAIPVLTRQYRQRVS